MFIYVVYFKTEHTEAMSAQAALPAVNVRQRSRSNLLIIFVLFWFVVG